MGLYKQVDTYSSYIKMAEYSSKEDMERVAIVMLSADHNEEKERVWIRHMTNCMDVSLTYWRKRHKKEMET